MLPSVVFSCWREAAERGRRQETPSAARAARLPATVSSPNYGRKRGTANVTPEAKKQSVEAPGFNPAAGRRRQAHFFSRCLIRANSLTSSRPRQSAPWLAKPNSENAASSARFNSRRLIDLHFSNSESSSTRREGPISPAPTGHQSPFPGSDHEPGYRCALLARCRNTNHLVLPDTPNRVETHVTHRKQTPEHCSTRDTSCHPSVRLSSAPAESERRGCLTPGTHTGLLEAARNRVLASRFSRPAAPADWGAGSSGARPGGGAVMQTAAHRSEYHADFFPYEMPVRAVVCAGAASTVGPQRGET
jgi:hypothetical protein